MTTHASPKDQQTDKTTPQVVVYSSPTCGFCHMVKEYLTDHGVAFEERDISTDQEALMYVLEKVGQAVTPITTIGEKVIVGFDRPQLDEALATITK